MASLEQEATQDDSQMNSQEGLNDQEEQDLHIAWLLAENLLERGGVDVVLNAASSSANPAQIIGQFIAQLIMQIHESLTGDLELSPRIYFSENGLVDIIGDYLEDEGIDAQVIDNAEVTALNIMQQVAQNNQGVQQQAAAPAMPAQGGM